MAHVRKQVRDAVIARVTGLATTASRVYASRVDPLEVGMVPGLIVRNGDELVERVALGMPSPLVRRAQTVIVAPHVRATSAIDDALDQVAEEVEEALLGSVDGLTVGGLAVDVQLVNIGEPRISGDGDRLVAAMDMQFQILINAREGIPDAVV